MGPVYDTARIQRIPLFIYAALAIMTHWEVLAANVSFTMYTQLNVFNNVDK